MPTAIIRQRNHLALASHTQNPQQPSAETRLNAIIARAHMTESAPASFFGEGVPDDWPPTEAMHTGNYHDRPTN